MSEIVNQSREYMEGRFAKELSPKNYYHNAAHTERVVKKINELAAVEVSTAEERELLELAGWFHDAGFLDVPTGDEELGAKHAREFLAGKGYAEDKIAAVERLILVTKKDTKPATQMEKIMKDADCSHVGAEYYFEVSDLLKQELEVKGGEKIDALEWLHGNQSFLKNHMFYTDYAKEHWQPQKDINSYELDKKVNKKMKKKAEKENAPRKLGRGVETMYRVNLKNHIELSAIADTKANILLSVNAIIISVALSSLLPKLDNASNAHLIVPALILTTFSVISIILSVLSTRPNISNVTVTRDMIKNKQTNILFFGNFYKMSLKDFEWGIDYLIDNEDVLYNSMTKDLYFLGLVLERKYRLLRITYNVFMVGIVVSVIAFVVGFLLRQKPPVVDPLAFL